MKAYNYYSMLKKISLSLLACSALVCLACTKKTGEKTVTLVMAEVNPAESFVGRVDAAFKEKAEELSAEDPDSPEDMPEGQEKP